MNRRMSNASSWRVSSGVPHICPERPRALRRHARQDRPGNPGLAGVTQVSMNMPRIQSTGPQTFSDIRKGFAAVEGHVSLTAFSASARDSIFENHRSRGLL